MSKWLDVRIVGVLRLSLEDECVADSTSYAERPASVVSSPSAVPLRAPASGIRSIGAVERDW